MNRKEGELGVYTGSSRQGKTYQLKKKIKSHRRVIVWSVKETVDKYGETWRDTIYISNLADLKRTITTIGSKPAHIVYTPRSLKDFGGWAKCAHAWGVYKECSAVGEELADVTSPSKAPPGWGELVRQGLGWGINIYAVTQRPAESDKTIMGNATYFHCHFMSRAADRKYMAQEMDIPVEQIAGLQKYRWIERINGGGLKKG